MDVQNIKIVLIHGNGGATRNDHWLPWVSQKLEQLGIKVVAETFPDNEVAHESIWLPYLKNQIKTDENTILVGHSSGGLAALRFAEENRIYGSVVIGVNFSDLGDATEKESGYYDTEWKWNNIKANQNWIGQFASIDDPYIPIEQPRFIHEQLGSEYFEYKDKGHFMTKEFPELVDFLKNKLFG